MFCFILINKETDELIHWFVILSRCILASWVNKHTHKQAIAWYIDCDPVARHPRKGLREALSQFYFACLLHHQHLYRGGGGKTIIWANSHRCFFIKIESRAISRSDLDGHRIAWRRKWHCMLQVISLSHYMYSKMTQTKNGASEWALFARQAISTFSFATQNKTCMHRQQHYPWVFFCKTKIKGIPPRQQ